MSEIPTTIDEPFSKLPATARHPPASASVTATTHRSRGKSRPRRRIRRSAVSERIRTGVPTTEVSSSQRMTPVFNLLDDSSLVELENQADWLLENIGMEFRDDAVAIELFREAGARIEGERVTFEPGLARSICATAPPSFALYSLNPERTVTLGDNTVVLMPGYGSPFVTDLDNGRKYATLDDFHNFIKLTQTTPYLHHSGGTVVEPVDIPVNKRHLDMVHAHLTLSDKPFMGAVSTPVQARDSIAMATIAFGEELMSSQAVMQANININSPFVFDGNMSAALREYASAKQCVCISPAIFGGAMGPVTPAAICAQTLAEAMAGIALTQLVSPGCPVVFGSFHSTMNLRTGSLTFGTPEANLIAMALSQLGHRLNVPVRSGGGQITASNCADGQAMTDSSNAMWATLLTGSHQIWHAAGWLEGGLTMSYEKFILDVDNCGSLLRLLRGFEVNADTLSRESYLEAGPGENFLSTTHTLANYASANYESILGDTGPYENWAEQGRLTADQRANKVWKNMLKDYVPPATGEQVAQDLSYYVHERKAEMDDEWY